MTQEILAAAARDYFGTTHDTGAYLALGNGVHDLRPEARYRLVQHILHRTDLSFDSETTGTVISSARKPTS